MHLGWLGAGVLTFAAFSAGGAYAYVEAVGGPGTAKAAVQYGTGNAADVTAEGVAVPVNVFQRVRPILGQAANEAAGVAGGLATTPTTAAGDAYADPSQGPAAG